MARTVTLQISGTVEAVAMLAKHLNEKAELLETEAHDNDHERNKHVDRFRIRIGGDILSEAECENLRNQAFTLRYFAKQLQG